MKLRSPLVGLALALALTTLTACEGALPEQTEATRADARQTMKVLEAAEKLELKKDAMSIGDHWAIKVDGKEVATIEGLDLPTLGDTYSILSPEGGFIAGEDEDIFAMAKTARFYDIDQKPTGTLTKDLLSFGARYELEDPEGKRIASLEQKFGLTFMGMIKDGEGEHSWQMVREAMAMSPEIHMARDEDSDAVATIDAILMAVVASEIYDAENESK